VKDPLFVTREGVLARVDEALADPATGFLLVAGEPGSGKTALLASIAHREPRTLRYFIRRDSTTPLASGSAQSFLLAVGHQLAATRPELFVPERLRVVVEQRIGSVAGRAIGVQVDDLSVSPFLDTSIQVHQEAAEVSGELVGLLAKRLVTDERLLTPDVLQDLALFAPAAVPQRDAPEERIVVFIDGLDELHRSTRREDLLSWLRACPELPPNMRLVLSSRPDALLDAFRRSRGPQLLEVALGAEVAGVDDDLRRYTVGFLEQAGVREALAARTEDPDGFASVAVRRADGNFQYLAATFRAMAAAVSTANDRELDLLLDFAALPTDLSSLYATFIDLVRVDVAGTDVEVRTDLGAQAHFVPSWEGLYAPLLSAGGARAAVLEPLIRARVRQAGRAPPNTQRRAVSSNAPSDSSRGCRWSAAARAVERSDEVCSCMPHGVVARRVEPASAPPLGERHAEAAVPPVGIYGARSAPVAGASEELDDARVVEADATDTPVQELVQAVECPRHVVRLDLRGRQRPMLAVAREPMEPEELGDNDLVASGVTRASVPVSGPSSRDANRPGKREQALRTLALMLGTGLPQRWRRGPPIGALTLPGFG
jgi:AAA ATPase domain